jgi:glycosyltransferase involved in cell wall biosynthesis
MLDVAIVTYNQETCIAQAIDSVLMQKTNFPFRIIIGEDCSTDNTLQICQAYAKKYPNKVVLIQNEQNIGLVKNYKSVFEACTAKYLAILEGDDFWMDEYKLQKQVDILQKDDKIGFVHANFTFFTNGKHTIYEPPAYAKLDGKIFESLIIGNYIGPLTVVLRKDILDSNFDFKRLIDLNYKTIDYTMWLELSHHSEAAYINTVVAAYRKEKGSISNPNDFEKVENFAQTQVYTLNYYYKKYFFNENLYKTALNNLYYGLFLKAIHFNNFEKIKFYKLKLNPFGFKQKVRYHLTFNKATIKIAKFLKLLN